MKNKKIKSLIGAGILTYSLGLLVSCEKEYNYTPPPAPVAAQISFKSSIAPIFSVDGCNKAGCHSGATPKQGLNLTPDSAYHSLFAKSEIDTVANKENPETNKLYLKISSAGSMSKYLKSATDRDSILDWISQGAKNN